jgi:hypothetical protein
VPSQIAIRRRRIAPHDVESMATCS